MVMITSPCPCWTTSVLRCFGTDWLTQPCFVLCFSLYFTVLHVLRLVSVAVLWLPYLLLAMLFLHAVGSALVLPAVSHALLPTVGFALLPAVGFALLASFHPLPSTMSAAMRAHRRFDVLLAVLVTVLLYFVSSRHRLFGCFCNGSFGCGSVSDPLQS